MGSQAESLCYWYGASHFNTFGGSRFDVASPATPGHYWLMQSPFISVPAFVLNTAAG